MNVGAYRHVLAIRETRRILLLGFLVRVPMFAGTVILTLHVVTSLGRSYGQAGLVTAAATVAVAVSGPWRGRLLDRIGLRRTVGPSIVVQLICWSIAPWVDYAPLVALAALAGLFVVPTFSILRQVILRATPTEQRRTALSLDSAATELSFMAGPALGVWMATSWNTSWALFVCEMASAAAGFVIWLVNPALSSTRLPAAPPSGEHPHDAEPARRAPQHRRAFRGFITLPVAAVYLAAAASTLVLTGTDVGVVAALREFEQPESIGWVLALWGAGSLVGGLAYGAWHRSFSVFWLLGGLAVTTAPVALAVGVPSFAVLITVCGVLCAPTITATVEQLSRLVPERFRGEMMGWHGSAMTAGSALGAPIAGFAIDHGGWRWGFLSVSALGLLVALAGLAVTVRRDVEPDRGPESTDSTESSQPTSPTPSADQAVVPTT
ncbi:MAG TPA: MFS transporter [Intrasporangium sp.]|uniref:MFS transporter n=1 Tax=Intrasporangium sp. TaxID=1925024 RepID=UPI002B4845A1|nr:MFS transporter [Intrasporangium sp.]HKX66530.1 MFS transporter [Intrasporangium sp.]